MIGIINYGLGNIKAFANVYRTLNIPFEIINQADQFSNVDKIILPGVGSFDYAMQRLNNSGLREILDKLVIEKKILIIGICVGMQMLTKNSEEGTLPGLGWIDAEVKKFDFSTFDNKIQIPHMGWNDVTPVKTSRLLLNLEKDARYYFLHSYYVRCRNIMDILAVSEYGIEFPCIVNSGNIYGIQFHPEKSHQWGIQLLKNFATMGEKEG